MKNFDLMKGKPALDIPTLNFIWDGLCRQNLCNNRKNADKRAVYNEREKIMRELERLAIEAGLNNTQGEDKNHGTEQA